MPAAKFTDEQLKEALTTMSNRAAANHFGVDIRNIERRRAKLARQGWSPEHDLRHQVPDGFHLKGASTLYKEGKPVLQWVKSSIDHERQTELIREGIGVS